ncbi:ferredoxin-type protein napF [Vibrio ishigakensis]|uniref:Ferredoxin-type protein napF n=1 Tax=Vibrio ishigakensis TaxID=1481914 RepID=A0A0B8PCV1_9VIBR|nr:ferredoxin-type protein napF [Vibrio ishigakensis]
MPESIDNQRRGFLSRVAKPVQQLKAEAEVHQRTMPRPPRAVAEPLFEHLCDNCGECVFACPNSVIEKQEANVKVNLDYNACSFCDACAQVCPTGALHMTTEQQIDLMPKFAVACNNHLGLDCVECQSACGKGAISIEDGELPELNADKCNGCGECRSACYIGAVSMELVRVATV